MSHPELSRSRTRPGSRRGQALALVAVMLVALLGFAALAIDIGHLYQTKAGLQGVADAAALAAAQAIPNEANVKLVAQQYATQNDPDHGTIVKASDVVIGNWDGFGKFTPGGIPTNAVRVAASRHTSRNNSVALFFARVLGISSSNVSAWATATSGGAAGGVESPTRFLLDDEVIDTDEKVIEDLAKKLGKKPEDLIYDTNGDWFVEIPVGTQLTLRTGQESDPGLWDISHSAWPFVDGTNNRRTFQDFLNWNKDGTTMGGVSRKSFLTNEDPKWISGVTGVNHSHLYQDFVNPGKCQVSPLYKSDLAPETRKGVPGVKAEVDRRGLLAFSVEGIGNDPPGSYLPDIIIKVCDPSPYVNGDGTVKLPKVANLPIRLVQ